MVTYIDILASDVVQLLYRFHKKVALAESCTGGLVGAAITSVSGSSKVFDLGICTYANDAKIKQLGVCESVLNTKGAVSFETALQMAEGVRKLADADYAVSVTGIAGPKGGTPEKPVGTVFISCCTRTYSTYLHLQIQLTKIPVADRRDLIRKEAVKQALILLRDTVMRER